MIGLLNEFLPAAGASVAASIVLKATVVAALGLFGAWLLRARRALRHAVLTAAFAVLLVLPAGAILAPPVRIAVQATHAPAAGVFLNSADSSRDTPVPLAISKPSKHAPALPLSNLLLAVWLCGTALFLMPVAIGVWQVDRIRRSALPWDCAQSAAGALARECGARWRIEVAIHEALPGPMTCGIFRPAIMFPRDTESWSGEELNRALIHELEHARRGDWAIHCLARAVCAAYWFHPLVWMAWRRLALAAERACDDAVLVRSEAAAYADQLVGLATRLQSPAKAALLAMANRADLGARVRAILDSRQPRGRAGLGSVALASAAAVALALTISPLRIAAAPQIASGAISSAVSRAKFEVVSITPCKPGEQAAPNSSPGRLSTGCTTVADLIRSAYILCPTGSCTRDPSAPRILGGPEWIQTERYLVNARASGTPSRDMMMGPMLQTVLEDRFRLHIRHENREMPVYFLTVAKSGARLTSFAPGKCIPVEFGIVPPRSTDNCRAAVNPKAGQVDADGISLGGFSKLLFLILNRPVIDKTGTTGLFDFHMTFGVDDTTPFLDPKSDGTLPPPEPPEDPAGPSIFGVLQRQFGLKVESGKGPREFVIIDRVERPSEN